ncbi:MAG TPA: DUF1330 domain-containing protein [Candidatus Eremiobacteraceae bacterium]|nr:DUF1330 domain-containing protein [Candidatus Eremiobacteraceae bacterium]
MAAYMVFTRESTRDPKELETYSKMVPATLAGHPVTLRARYGHHEVVEGPEIEGVVILEFPTIEAAKAWYNSPAYREAREHRFKGAKYTAVIVQGV